MDIFALLTQNPLLLVGIGVAAYLYFNRTDTDSDGNPEIKIPLTGKSIELDSKSLDSVRDALTGVGLGFLSELIGHVPTKDFSTFNAKAERIANDLKDPNMRQARLLPAVESHIKDVGKDRSGLSKVVSMIENEKKNIADEAARLNADVDLTTK